MKEQTHYYLIGNEIKKGGEMPKISDPIQSSESIDNYLIVWLNSLQPCSITDVELCKIKYYLAANTDTPFDLDNHFTCTIEVTDIVYAKTLITETKSGSWTDYEIVFKHPKSEANEAIDEKKFTAGDIEMILMDYRLYAWKNGVALQDLQNWIKQHKIFKTRNNK